MTRGIPSKRARTDIQRSTLALGALALVLVAAHALVPGRLTAQKTGQGPEAEAKTDGRAKAKSATDAAQTTAAQGKTKTKGKTKGKTKTKDKDKARGKTKTKDKAKARGKGKTKDKAEAKGKPGRGDKLARRGHKPRGSGGQEGAMASRLEPIAPPKAGASGKPHTPRKPAAPAPAQRPKPKAKPSTTCQLLTREAPRGGRLEVRGKDFAKAALVRIGGQVTRMIERTADTIAVQIPRKSNGGKVTLQTNGRQIPCGRLRIIGLN